MRARAHTYFNYYNKCFIFIYFAFCFWNCYECELIFNDLDFIFTLIRKITF